MSYVSTFNALNTTNTTSGQKLVLSVIASFERNGKAWPSVATIAKRCSMGARTVQRHIAALVSLGYLQRIYRTGKAAITRVFIGETPAKLAPVTPAKLAPNESGNFFESVNDSGTPPTTPEPQHQHTTDPAAAMPPSLFSDIEQPEQPADQASQRSGEIFAMDCNATPPITDIEQPANTTTEAPKTPYSASNEADTTNPTQTPATPVTAPAIEADPVEAEWAKVDPQVLLDLIEIRREKRKGKPKTTEIKHWYSIALESGFTLAQIAYVMVLNNWSKLNDASWLEHVPRPQMTATGAPAIPAAPKVWTPDLSHIPASATTLAAMKEKIRQMKERWAASELAQTAPPPMRQ